MCGCVCVCDCVCARVRACERAALYSPCLFFGRDCARAFACTPHVCVRRRRVCVRACRPARFDGGHNYTHTVGETVHAALVGGGIDYNCGALYRTNLYRHGRVARTAATRNARDATCNMHPCNMQHDEVQCITCLSLDRRARCPLSCPWPLLAILHRSVGARKPTFSHAKMGRRRAPRRFCELRCLQLIPTNAMSHIARRSAAWCALHVARRMLRVARYALQGVRCMLFRCPLAARCKPARSQRPTLTAPRPACTPTCSGSGCSTPWTASTTSTR